MFGDIPGGDVVQYGALGLLGILVLCFCWFVYRVTPEAVRAIGDWRKSVRELGPAIAAQMEKQDLRHKEWMQDVERRHEKQRSEWLATVQRFTSTIARMAAPGHNGSEVE